MLVFAPARHKHSSLSRRKGLTVDLGRYKLRLISARLGTVENSAIRARRNLTQGHWSQLTIACQQLTHDMQTGRGLSCGVLCPSSEHELTTHRIGVQHQSLRPWCWQQPANHLSRETREVVPPHQAVGPTPSH